MVRTMSAHVAHPLDVAVEGGTLHAIVWEPVDEVLGEVVLVHGVTSSLHAWDDVVPLLPGYRLIAPDLRGRGASNGITHPAGMAAHAADLAALLDAANVTSSLVVGHSMGAFVSLAFAYLCPERVSRLLLIDGGLPLDVPAGLDTDTLVAAILGPTAERLSRRFASVDDYLDFWRVHPAFRDDWSATLEDYLAYDLVDDGAGMLRPATSYEITAADTLDMNTGDVLPAALAALAHPTRFLTVPRGLQNEEPGLYAPDYLERLLPTVPGVVHSRIPGFNHYTIVLSGGGAAIVAAEIREQVAAASDSV